MYQVTRPLVVFSNVAAMLIASTALAQNHPQAGDVLVRARAIYISPDESSTITPIGGKADISNETVPELDFTYFFTDNIAAELILGTAKHHAKAKGTAAGTFDAGSAWVLPPTLTLQYHFTSFNSFKPYVGAGINYTMYLSEDGGSQPEMEMDDAFGIALQAGVDVPLDARWSMNFDVKKIYVDADAEWNGGAVTADIDLDPWIVGFGVGYRF